MSWHTLHTNTATHCASWHYHAHIVAPIALILNYEVKTLYLLKTAFCKPPAAPCHKPRSPALTLHRRFPARRRTKTKTTRHRRATPKTNNDQTKTKTQRMPQHRTKGKIQHLVFCSTKTTGEQEHVAKNKAPAVSPYSAATDLSKRMTMNKRLLACALASLRMRSNCGSGPFLVPFWESKKGQ